MFQRQVCAAEDGVEMSGIHWFSVDEVILRLGEITMLEWAHCVKPYSLQREG